MKRPIIIAGLSLVVVFGAVTVWKESRQVDAVEGEHTGLSEERKESIRRFWEIYHQATDLKQRGEWQQAVSAYQQALEINPQHEDALYYLGNSLFELERYEEAVKTWRRLIEVNPMSARAHAQLGAVYSCGAPGAPFDLGVAEQEFRRALAINKEETGPVVKLGEVALLKGDREQSLSYLTAASQTNFKSIEAHYLIGYLRWLEGDRAAALISLQKAVKFSHGDKPIKGVAGEGDTEKKAAQPIVAEGASRKSLFTPYWRALQEWEEVSLTQMEEEYKKLDTALGRVLKERRRDL